MGEVKLRLRFRTVESIDHLPKRALPVFSFFFSYCQLSNEIYTFFFPAATHEIVETWTKKWGVREAPLADWLFGKVCMIIAFMVTIDDKAHLKV